MDDIRLFPNYGMAWPYSCSLTVGIGELKKNHLQMTIAPNPTLDDAHIVVNCNDTYEIEIRNSIGDLLFVVAPKWRVINEEAGQPSGL